MTARADLPSITPRPPGVQRGHDGAALIAAERLRQIEQEGYTAEHDDGHPDEMAMAAIGYIEASTLTDAAYLPRPNHWPWDPESWKPSPDPIRNLVKAGALIAAEIDRLQRAAT